MEQTSPANRGADPDGQRDDVRNLHGGGVPKCLLRETARAGLAARIPGINPRHCCYVAATSRRKAHV